MFRRAATHIVLAVAVLFSLVVLASTQLVQNALRSPYSAVAPDGDALCNELLQDWKQRSPPDDKKSRLSALGEKEVDIHTKLWELCKKREEVEELNRRYREANTVLGRLGNNSGLLLTFATAVATIYIAYLGSKWTTTKSNAEQRHFEQRRSIDRDEYDFKLFDSLSNPTSPLGRMAASAALQARLKEIESDLENIRDAKETGVKIDDTLETEGNLRNEQEMIVRVFLSALKISRVRIGESNGDQAGSNVVQVGPVEVRPSAVTVAQEAASLTGIYNVLSGQALEPDHAHRNDALQIVANKAIAEAIAEVTGCYTRRNSPSTERSPLIGYDMQKVDLRDVYWGSQSGSKWRNGRAGFNGRGLDFFQSDLSRASFRDALLEGAVFYGATLTKTQFRGASLKEANFSDAQLVDCDFRGADLESCDLSGATLVNPRLDRETKLAGVKWPAGFTPALS